MASVSESQAPETSVEGEEIIPLNQNGVNASASNPVSNSEPAPNTHPGDNGPKRFGKVKWFNVTKGWGFIAAEDGSQDVFVHQSVIRMEGFRSLAEGERVEFEARESDKGLEATVVTGPDGNPCQGSNRHPVTKKKFRKARCYNCGEFANHVAARCDKGIMPKRCHNCRSEEHLIKDCPLKARKQNGHSEGTESSASGNDGATGEGDNKASPDKNQVAPSSPAAEPESNPPVPVAANAIANAPDGSENKNPKSPKKK